MRIQHYAIWVGAEYYPTFDNYVKEARKLGCCRKVPVLPKELEVGKSRVYLFYRDPRRKTAYIMAYFTVDGIIKCAVQQRLIDEMRLIGSQAVLIPDIGPERRIELPRRGCGEIDPPSYYLVGPQDITLKKGWRRSYSDDKEPIHLLKRQIKYLGRNFRGIRKFNREIE